MGVQFFDPAIVLFGLNRQLDLQQLIQHQQCIALNREQIFVIIGYYFRRNINLRKTSVECDLWESPANRHNRTNAGTHKQCEIGMFQRPVGMRMIAIISDHADGQTMIIVNRTLPRHRCAHWNIILLGQP